MRSVASVDATIVAFQAQLVVSEYEIRDGSLVHFVDERERAVVPPAGFAEYAKQWPSAEAYLVSQGLLAPSATPVKKPAGKRR